MQIALVAGWARGETNVGNPFFGHLERIRDAYPDPRTRARIVAGRGPLTATDGSSIPASPAANTTYSPGAELAAMQPLPTTPPTQEGYQEQQQPSTDFFDDLRDAGLEMDTDRPGMDITSFDLPSPDPAMCMTACQDYGGCTAFTYVKPGMQGTAARCWLKSGIPAPVQSTCCISGTP